MKYSVAIIGGGPAGIMAAGRASELGSHVVLIEKNKKLGRKLLITGKGRCNITNAESELRKIIEKFGKNGKFLYQSLHNFGTTDTINFFKKLGIKTKIERGNRVFPTSNKSKDVLNALYHYLEKSNVGIMTNTEVNSIIKKGNKIDKIILTDKKEIIADKYIICTGGKSYPITGSTGDGYSWAKSFGHKIVKLKPSLISIITKENYVKSLEGLSLKNVEISIFQNNKKIDSKFGEAIFTASGMSGPIILDMSKKIGDLLKTKLELKIDFKPALDFTKLDKRLQRDFMEQSNKMFKNCLDKLLPQKLIPVIIRLSKIDPEKKVNLITKEERKKLLHLLKEFTLTIKALPNFDGAIITSGGVNLSEIDPKTMQSKIIENLYFAGEILDLDGPTGGYNLQMCWSTGFAAGSAITTKK